MYTYNPKRWTAVHIILHNHASIVVTLGINTSTWIVESNEFTRENGLKQKDQEHPADGNKTDLKEAIACHSGNLNLIYDIDLIYKYYVSVVNSVLFFLQHPCSKFLNHFFYRVYLCFSTG